MSSEILWFHGLFSWKLGRKDGNERYTCLSHIRYILAWICLRTGKLIQVSVHWSDHKNMTVKFLVVGTESWISIVIIKLQVFGVNSISFFFFWKENKNKLYIALFCFSDALYYNGDGGFAENCVSQTVDHLKPITFSDVPLTYTPYM